MPRPASTYRAARRNAHKASKAPWPPSLKPVARKSAYQAAAEQLARRAKPIKHPGANPLFCLEGREREVVKAPHPIHGAMVVVSVTRGPRNPSKYLPHIGAKQRAKAARAS